MAALTWPGRRIIVLGGMGGLGQAVVERFRSQGASVLVADSRLPADANRREDLDYVTVDALDESSISAAFAVAPPAQAVVNLIGGYASPQPLPELDIAVLRKQLELNLVTAAIVRACQIFCVSWGSRCPFVILLWVVSGVRVRRGRGRGT